MKTKIGAEMTKEEEAVVNDPPSAPAYVPQAYAPQAYAPQALPQHTTVLVHNFQGQDTKVDHGGATCWYVLGILSSIFCCPIFGLIGLVHAMLAKHEGEQGKVESHRRRLFQAKCWTSWSIGVGLFCFIMFVVVLAVVTSRHRGGQRIDSGGVEPQDYQKHGEYPVTGQPGNWWGGSSPATNWMGTGGTGKHGNWWGGSSPPTNWMGTGGTGKHGNWWGGYTGPTGSRGGSSPSY